MYFLKKLKNNRMSRWRS